MSHLIKPRNYLSQTAIHGRRVKGFTLLELLVVVAIIGTLAAIAIPAYNKYVDKAKVTVAVGTLDTIRKTLEFFHMDNQRYPQAIIFATGEETSGGLTVFSGPLLEQINDDLTAPDYQYNTSTLTYILTAKAKNRAQTFMTMTAQQTTY